MEQRSAQADEIKALYATLREAPKFLDDIDEIPFADTPLHTAASSGLTHLALEIMNLKPSFGRKRNPDGFSPLHLALRHRQTETVIRLVKHHPDLIRVQGREGMTPLHYVAETDDADLLAEFLLVCPASVEDLTIRGENAVFVAIKHKNIGALNVLLGWIRRANKGEILDSRDEEGNTLLHVAVKENLLEVVNDLIKYNVRQNEKNLRGLTALDIAEQAEVVNEEIIRVLCRAGAGRADTLPRFDTLSQFLSSKELIIELLLRIFIYTKKDLTLEMRNVLLVVAALISTATYQGVLSPPGGIWQGEGNNPPNTKISTTFTSSNSPAAIDISPSAGNDHLSHDKFIVGKAVMINSEAFKIFIVLNTIAFVSSTGMVLLLLHLRPYTGLLLGSLFLLTCGYSYVLQIILLPTPLTEYFGIIWALIFFFIYLLKLFFFVFVDGLDPNFLWLRRSSADVTNFIYKRCPKYLQGVINFAHRLRMQHQVNK